MVVFGMVKLFVLEMYIYFENVIVILDVLEIKDQVGYGVVWDFWNVVESISCEEFGSYFNIFVLCIVVFNVCCIMLDIVDYFFVIFDEDFFQNFIRNVEVFIVGKS